MAEAKIKDAIGQGQSVKINCRALRVGTYKLTKKSPAEVDFILDVCEHGIRFIMPRSVPPTTKTFVYVPKHSTATVMGSWEHPSLLFLAFLVEEKFAENIRETLGIERDSGCGVWFDPTSEKEYEKYIVTVIDRIPNRQKDFVRNVYKDNLDILETAKGRKLLLGMSPQVNCRREKGCEFVTLQDDPVNVA